MSDTQDVQIDPQDEDQGTPRWVPVLMLVLVVLVGVGIWQSGALDADTRVVVSRELRGIMGTTCKIDVLVPPGRKQQANEAIDRAEKEIRRIELTVSSWIDESEIGRLNRAKAGIEVPLSDETLTLLRSAREAYEITDGAFDVTCRPLIELWRQAGHEGRLPTDEEIAAARDASGWSQLELGERSATKAKDTVRVDLGGIAKGYAIDRAGKTLYRLGIKSGQVDIGGDLRVFGTPPRAGSWTARVKDPRRTGMVARFTIRDRAVCTSGDYARFVEIEGERFSHIIDPRTGRPVRGTASVTVIAPTARQADIWATALSVLGPKEGFARLKSAAPDAEAMTITGGDGTDPQFDRTDGFPELVE